jgi:methionyl aminopeptidase
VIGATAIELKSAADLERMRVAGRLLAEVFDEVLAAVKPGVTTRRLDEIAARAIAARRAKPAFLGYHGFPATVCSSVNEEVVHGIPGNRALGEGDIVGIDIGLVRDGLYADRATTMPVGRVSPEVAQLLRVTVECLERAIAACRVGNRLQDIGRAVQSHAEAHGYGVVREYSGHGIGRRMHEAPQVPNYVPKFRNSSGLGAGNLRLRAGMALALEPMINLGTHETRTLEDNWTVVTLDGLPSAHFEHTVFLTTEGPEVLTGEQPAFFHSELDRWP